MSDFKVSVPRPCPKDWEAMSPTESGRHCSFCAKTVVDFTSMNAEQIKNFFIQRREQEVCGHFRVSQLATTPTPRLHSRLNRLYQYLDSKISLPFLRTAALFSLSLCMTLVGCENPTKEKTVSAKDTVTTKDTIKTQVTTQEPTLTGDSISIKPNDAILQGGARPINPHIKGKTLFIEPKDSALTTLGLTSPPKEKPFVNGEPVYEKPEVNIMGKSLLIKDSSDTK